MTQACFGLILIGFNGCDYWPPTLQSHIEGLRTELNDALDKQQQLEFENSGLKTTQESLQREVHAKVQENEELRRHLTALTTAHKQAVVSATVPFDLARSPALSPTHPSRPSSTSGSLSRTVAAPSARGPRIVEIQRLLQRQGLPIRNDGIYGPSTTAAVRTFQRRHRLIVDGVVGSTTYAALRRHERKPQFVRQLWLQRPPLRGRDVTQVQRALRRAGYRIPIDGHYGPETDVALTRFQRKQGLEADGIVGPQTWAALTSVKISGSDVAAISSTTPLQGPPRPSRSAIRSPSRQGSPSRTPVVGSTDKLFDQSQFIAD
jgi:peptidoglycan hydrolase-like protein with peptidoglycan-binding domain